MSTTIDTATKIPTNHPEHKRVPSEKSRRIVLDMIDQEVNQSITERSMERRNRDGRQQTADGSREPAAVSQE